VRQLPFELAALPQTWFGTLRLPVVSYALPALIAIGQVRHGMRPTRNPLLHWLRNRCRKLTLEKLNHLQPDNGGFLEAAPLTSFVVMSLAQLGNTSHPVVRRGVAFLEASVREDGSWPIDTNLATWLTTLAVNALASAAENHATSFSSPDRSAVRDWLLNQQYRRVHPYTLAAPGGWAWTDLPGGVPDADDTAGAILALISLGEIGAHEREAVREGVSWLLGVQNRDGGVPTFCRGWGRLPFDRSSPDITAHAIRAWIEAQPLWKEPQRRAMNASLIRATNFLLRTQRSDGTWIPLWFGHQEHPADENPLYGTTRVLLALVRLDDSRSPPIADAIEHGLSWLISNQHSDGGWSGATGAASSVEETSLALESLAAAWMESRYKPAQRVALGNSLRRGGVWLADAIEHQRWDAPSPIGFYFAKLWYFERLYPLIFATGALARLARLSSLSPPR
jgi:squalene-hopene/tetraprenyl-beta-curcumene cyclase